MQKKTVKDYTFAVGRRKSSVARVRLFKGKGQTTINQQPAEQYFSGAVQSALLNRPFQLIGMQDKYWASVKVAGGGKQGQLGSVVHGLSRAFCIVDPNNRQVLKKHGLLTRDSRTRERRKVGTGGKARRKKQSPKR